MWHYKPEEVLNDAGKIVYMKGETLFLPVTHTINSRYNLNVMGIMIRRKYRKVSS